jgi:hypothetical protein
MARIYRPAIPIEVKCRVALRQLGEIRPDEVINNNRPRSDAGYMVGIAKMPGRSLGRLLPTLLERLADLLGCAIEDLRLDHDPPLAARPQERRGLGRKTYYTPDANDPEYLFYRPHGAQFDGSHDVKTRIRGDHGQYSDVVLIKRQRRRERPPKPKAKIKSRGFDAKAGGKPKWPSRPFKKRNP